MENSTYIPMTLDDPPLILFWERDTAMIAAFPVVLGFMSQNIMIGVAISFVLTKANLKVKDEGGVGALKAFAYWFFPTNYVNKKLLPSHIREYIGA